MHRGGGDVEEGRNQSLQVIEGMDFYPAHVLAELSPPEDIQAQRYGRGIESIDVTVKLEDVRCPLTSGLTDEIIGILLEDAIVTIGIGFCQIASGDVLAKPEMIALLVMCLDGDNHITQTLAIAQLAKHQRKELVPTCEVIHVFVPSILTDEIVEVIPVKEGSQLSKDVF